MNKLPPYRLTSYPPQRNTLQATEEQVTPHRGTSYPPQTNKLQPYSRTSYPPQPNTLHPTEEQVTPHRGTSYHLTVEQVTNHRGTSYPLKQTRVHVLCAHGCSQDIVSGLWFRVSGLRFQDLGCRDFGIIVCFHIVLEVFSLASTAASGRFTW